jgi:hypothetical protein
MHPILHYLYDFLSFWTDEREFKHHLLARIERSGDHIFGGNMSSAACRADSGGDQAERYACFDAGGRPRRRKVIR